MHKCNYPVLNNYVTNNVANPDPGSRIRCLFDPWIWDPDSGWKTGSYFLELRTFSFGLKYLKLFYADPGWKNLDPGQTSRIRNTALQHWKELGMLTVVYNFKQQKAGWNLYKKNWEFINRARFRLYFCLLYDLLLLDSAYFLGCLTFWICKK